MFLSAARLLSLQRFSTVGRLGHFKSSLKIKKVLKTEVVLGLLKTTSQEHSHAKPTEFLYLKFAFFWLYKGNQ